MLKDNYENAYDYNAQITYIKYSSWMVILASISCLKLGFFRVYSHNLNIFKLGNVFFSYASHTNIYVVAEMKMKYKQ